MRYIKDLTEGSRIQGIYYCKSKLCTVTKNGKPYESIVLQDKTGVLDTKVWDPNNAGIGEYEAGDYIDVVGDVVIFSGAHQGRLTRIRKCEEGEYDPGDYMPVSSQNIGAMYEELLLLTESVEAAHYRELLKSFFEEEKFASAFKKSSAAKTVHHAFIGGLLEHSLNVAKICDFMAERYPLLNRDLLVTAALLHDIGKTRELSAFPANEYTEEGQLMGHIVLGTMMVSEHIAQMETFPVQAATDLKHCILSHHGELEYGSPKKPALLEALALNLADNMDAKMETMGELVGAPEARGWLGFCKFLDTNVRKTEE